MPAGTRPKARPLSRSTRHLGAAAPCLRVVAQRAAYAGRTLTELASACSPPGRRCTCMCGGASRCPSWTASRPPPRSSSPGCPPAGAAAVARPPSPRPAPRRCTRPTPKATCPRTNTSVAVCCGPADDGLCRHELPHLIYLLVVAPFQLILWSAALWLHAPVCVLFFTFKVRPRARLRSCWGPCPSTLLRSHRPSAASPRGWGRVRGQSRLWQAASALP